jgi:hypothetical protein
MQKCLTVGAGVELEALGSYAPFPAWEPVASAGCRVGRGASLGSGQRDKLVGRLV